jgi:polysaccharide export outer membrane protein
MADLRTEIAQKLVFLTISATFAHMKYKKPLLLVLMTLSLGSCVSHKQLVSFPSETAVFNSPEQLLNAVELKIQPDDLLRITVLSFDQEASAPFNIEGQAGAGGQQNGLQQQGGGIGTSNGFELFSGYFVDREGFINFPVLGRLKVAGLTMSEVEKLVSDGVKPYLKDGVVNARFLNFKITFLGEVSRPGTIRLSNQRINMLEALGMAGDFTSYANRTNVLLIREQNGQRFYQRLNFQDPELIHSPYFYLQQNDVVYVEPTQAKVATVSDPFQRFFSYGSAVLSVVTLVIALFR